MWAGRRVRCDQDRLPAAVRNTLGRASVRAVFRSHALNAGMIDPCAKEPPYFPWSPLPSADASSSGVPARLSRSRPGRPSDPMATGPASLDPARCGRAARGSSVPWALSQPDGAVAAALGQHGPAHLSAPHRWGRAVGGAGASRLSGRPRLLTIPVRAARGQQPPSRLKATTCKTLSTPEEGGHAVSRRSSRPRPDRAVPAARGEAPATRGDGTPPQRSAIDGV